MKTISISEETYEAIKDQLSGDERLDVSSIDDFVGKTFFFRTVTYHLIGKVEAVIGKILQLEPGAVWVADSGRFMQAISEGKLDEVEPIKTAWFVNLDATTDFGVWKHEIPTVQK